MEELSTPAATDPSTTPAEGTRALRGHDRSNESRSGRTAGKVVGGTSGHPPLVQGTQGNRMNTATQNESPVAVVRIEGVVGRDSIEACDYFLSRSTEGTAGAVIDLSLATGFEREAAAILVARRRVLKAQGRELVVAAGLSDVRSAIRAHSGSEVQVFVTPEEALAYVRGSVPAVSVGQKLAKKKGK